MGGSCNDPILTMTAEFGVLQQTHGLHSCAKFRLDCFILSPSGGNKPQILPFYGLWHLAVSPLGVNLIKLNTGEELQTFAYPTASKSFLYSNAFLAKSGAQTLTFNSVMDKQTDRQKNSMFLATPAPGEI